MAAAAPRKLGDISLGSDQTTQTRRSVVIEWSDDDENLVAPPPSVQTPSRITHVEEQPREDEEVPEQQTIEMPTERATGVPEQQTKINPERRVEEPLEQQVE